MSETSAIPRLAFSRHFARLCQISTFFVLALKLFHEHERRSVSESASDVTPEQARLDLETLIASASPGLLPHIYALLSQTRDPTSLKTGAIFRTFIGEPSRQLVCNLSLVMLCTEMELFIEHLIDVILSSCPLRIKDLASEKELKAGELVDLKTYEEIMRAIRRKVSKEVTDDSTRRMFEHHLGSRFGLFRKEELSWGEPLSDKVAPNWGMLEIESAFAMRHKIVHEGDLSCTPEYFDSVWQRFLCLVTFLCQRARANYDLKVNTEDELDMWVKTYGIG